MNHSAEQLQEEKITYPALLNDTVEFKRTWKKKKILS